METHSASELNRFLVVEFTDDDIAYKSNRVRQNPDAQDFYHLHQHLHSSQLPFEDPDFITTNYTVLGHESTTLKSNIQWLRPSAISPHPKFIVGVPSEFSLEKRNALHSFLSTAMVSLTTNERVFRRTVPTDNSLDERSYTGMFHFRFWQYGRWVDVVIDDRLPTVDGKLIFMRPTLQNEFWFALLEKAYAKLCGSYSAIISHTVAEAMQDFTGGITERYYLGDAISDVVSCYDTISRKLNKGSIMAAIKVRKYQGSQVETHTAYSILKTITIKSMLIGLQTPVEELVELNFLRTDGTAECFRKSWLRFDEFIRLYDRVEICNVLPDSMGKPTDSDWDWQLSCIEGAWVTESTAGGPRDVAKCFWKNPQYIVQLVEPDKLDNSGMCHLVISLMQKPRTGAYLPISFVVYRISESDFRSKPMPMTYSKRKEPKIMAYPTFSRLREITSHVKTSPGILLIVPCTQQRQLEGEFYMRIYSRPHRSTKENFKEHLPSMNEKHWHSTVRMFYSLADAKGSIDHTALAFVLATHVFDTKSGSKRPKGLWKSLARKHPTSAAIETSFATNEAIDELATLLMSRIQLDRLEQIGYDHFRRIVHDVQEWKGFFDFYDSHRTGLVEKKKLIKSLKKSTGGENKQQAVSALLRIVEDSSVEKISFEQFVLFLLKSQPVTQRVQIFDETLMLEPS